MEKFLFRTLFLKISNGSSSADARRDLPSGIMEKGGVLAHATVSGTNEKILIGLNENGNEVVPQIPATLYDGGEGHFDDRAFRTGYHGGGQIEVKARTADGSNVAADTAIIMTFKIYLEPTC